MPDKVVKFKSGEEVLTDFMGKDVKVTIYWLFVCLMVFNATFNNISVILWRSVLLVGETGGHGENHRPVVSHWQTLSHNVVHLAVKYIYLVKTVMFFIIMFLLLITWYTVSHGHMPQVNGNSEPSHTQVRFTNS
jgi:hypothetical protein